MKCNKCDIEKDSSEFHFHKRNSLKNYVRQKFEITCKACANAHRRERYRTDEKHRQKILIAERERVHTDAYKQQRRKYYRDNESHRLKVVQKQNQYAEANRDKESARSRAWRRANPEKLRLLNVAYGLANKEKISAQKKRYALEKPEVGLHNRRKRKARIRGATVVTVTRQQWLDRLEEFDHHCAYCWAFGIKLTQDHLIPISKGGSHSIDNLVPACMPCNMKKRTRSMMEVLKVVS